MSTEVLIGDCREVLKTFPDNSIHCCVTSPPYYGLRNYGVNGQIGLEETPEEYVEQLVKVFREVRRVLRDDGTCWLNLGDSYAGSTMTGGNSSFNAEGGEGGFKQGRQFKKPKQNSSLKPKDLIGIPWRVAFALQADGWYLRSDIIWSKPNPMPESVTDRPTKAHEYVFLLSKSERYFYDCEAVKEPCVTDENSASSMMFGSPTGKMNDTNKAHSHKVGKKWDYSPTRNKRSVWNIPTKPYSGAHFATFPLDLIDPCIKAGTSEKGCCPECGDPWVRVVEKGINTGTLGRKDESPTTLRNDALKHSGRVGNTCYKTVGWRPSCTCNAGDPIPCSVLDPFGGSGTVGEWCRHHQRNAVLIELNPEYKPLIDERTMQNIPELFSFGGIA